MAGLIEYSLLESWKPIYNYDKKPIIKLTIKMTSRPRYHAAANWHLLFTVITQGAIVLCNTFLLTMYIELGLCFKKNTLIIIVATLFKDMEWNARQINTQHCLKSLQYNVYILEKFWNCFSMYHGVSAACMFIGNIHTLLYLSCTDKISEQSVIWGLSY